MDLKTKIYNFLSDELTKGNIDKSDNITEQYLVNNLEVSRTPIREALFQLAADDILEKTPRKGYKFKKYSPEDIKNLYELIGILDGKIAYNVVDQLSEEDLSRMQFLIDSMNSAIKNKLYTTYNSLQNEFHNVYISKSTNSFLVSDLLHKKEIFIGKAYRQVNEKKLHNLLLQTNEEHQEILNLFKKRDSLKVRSYLENVHWNKNYALYDNWK